jgi:SET domain-containing protein
VDGSVGGSGAEYINHCCDPNLWAWIFKGHILYMSRREIRKGDELTIDYNFSKDVEIVRCRCGAKNCRGTINVD